MTQQLKREVGLLGAVMMGLGSVVGTGVFVSLGIAAGVTGPSVILALSVAALVAVCNGLSSARLAAKHPVSGGTYEYGYLYLTPSLGFAAGWLFLCAKTASAATAGLGFAGYVTSALGYGSAGWRIALAAAVVVIITLLVLSGTRRSNAANVVVVSATLLSLAFFVVAGIRPAWSLAADNLEPFFAPSSSAPASRAAGFLEACALMFVAYTGYGRIATLGEEVRQPETNIPRAIILTLAVSMVLYMAVAAVAVAVVGAEALASATLESAAPLEFAAQQFGIPGAAALLAMGAATAMLGVLLNLVLGLSRVVLAMGRRGDLPGWFAKINRSGTTPYAAVLLVGTAIAGLALLGSVKTNWSFSAFTVLIYYSLTNLAALRLPAPQPRFQQALSWLGLLACLFLAFWIEPRVWLVGLAVLLAGLALRGLVKRASQKDCLSTNPPRSDATPRSREPV